MPTPAELVERAVVGSFEEYLSDLHFEVASLDADGPTDLAVERGGLAAIGWTLRGTWSEPWPGLGAPTGTELVVTGATFVLGADANDADDVRFANVIDWSLVLAQTGTLVLDRPLASPA